MRRRPVALSFVVLVTALFSLTLAYCTSSSTPLALAPLPPGDQRELALTVAVSAPRNGTHFVSGDKGSVTITLVDTAGRGFSRDDFATLNLYLYGPQDPTKTVTAVKVLNASTDRSKTPHHYIDLLKDENVKVEGNTLTYALQAVTDEAPGTYTASLYAVSKANALQQTMQLADFQLGTATAEKQIVEKSKCASCHEGASSGKMYFRHIDPARSPTGNWSLDFEPVRTCKSCHNNDGYAAYQGDIADPTADRQKVRTPDPIVRRVHGVHMGEHLKNPFNIDAKTGNFRDWTGVLFPANVNNCTTCHVDDRWKTEPTRQACGACHDTVWFGDPAKTPKGMQAHEGETIENDARCGRCHAPEGEGKGKSVTDAHKVEQPMNKIDVSLTPPRNGKFYVAGEKPIVTLVIRDDKGNPIDHTKVDESTFSTASLFVYGPRYQAKPVLTSTAKNGNAKMRASASSSLPAAGTPTKGWSFAAGDTFKIAVNGGPVQVLEAPEGLQTPDQVRDWLRGNLKEVTVTSNNTAGSINILSNVQGASSRFEIYDSPVTAKMGWKPGPLNLVRGGVTYGKTAGTTVEPFVVMGAVSTAVNDLRPRRDPLTYTDPLVTRSVGNITYPLDDVGTVKPGTYMIYVYHIPSGVLAGTGAGPTGAPTAAAKALNVSRTGIGFLTFQVGTEKEDLKVATNCTKCHGDTIWHLDEGPIHAEPFDTDYCQACHDYNRAGTGDLFSRVGGNSTAGWAGYGAKPIVARVHGVHFGRYLTHPEWIYAGNPNAFNEVIFPQDVRNCIKCHGDDTTGTWKTEPSRLACTSCHDSDTALAHTNLMTQNPNPSDPYDAGRVETCRTCHGAGREFAPDKVHNVATPYKPPYRREPEEK